jgi:hypothetical protein
MEKIMTNKNWLVMNDLQDAFNQITSFSFLLEQLQEAVDANETQKIVDITAALNAFYPPYCDNFDKKFSKAWDTFIKEYDPAPWLDISYDAFKFTSDSE